LTDKYCKIIKFRGHKFLLVFFFVRTVSLALTCVDFLDIVTLSLYFVQRCFVGI